LTAYVDGPLGTGRTSGDKKNPIVNIPIKIWDKIRKSFSALKTKKKKPGVKSTVINNVKERNPAVHIVHCERV
jgi:hypothetical protein